MLSTIRRAVSNICSLGSQLIHQRTLLILTISFCVGVFGFLWQVSRLSSQLIEQSALANTANYSKTVNAFRTLYTSEVVERVRPQGIQVRHDYDEHAGAIPLPATLTMLLGKRLTDEGSSKQVRLYSDYPFPWRKDGGPQDDFERDALRRLEENPHEPFYRFDDLGGHRVLRYATADLMRPSCVACHNGHPDSPKTDWKEGDVRGVLEIICPLDQIVSETQADLWGIYTFTATFGVLGLCCLGLVVHNLRRNSADLSHQVEEQTALLSASEAHIRSVVETAADGIITIDVQGTIETFNTAAARLFGYAPEEVIGRNVSLLMPAPHSRDHDGYLERYLRTGERHIIGLGREVDGKRKDGSTFPLQLSVSEAHSNGRRTFTGIVRDLTQRKRVEQELSKMSVAIEQSPVTVVITDTNGTIEYVNPKFTKVTGYTAEEAIGRNPRLLKSGDMSPDSYKTMWKTIRDGNIWRGEFHSRKKNGELYWESASISPVRNSEGIITHFLAIKEDITERKRAEAELQQHMSEIELAKEMRERDTERLAKLVDELGESKAHAEEATHAKSMFLANVSHEIRTPMNGIIGLSELLLDTELTPEQQKDLEMIKDSGKSLMAVINDILDFSKIEAGKLEISPVAFNLRDHVGKVLNTIALPAHRKGLELACQIAPDVPTRLIGDPDRLRQILINIVNNSIKFTESGEVVLTIDVEPHVEDHVSLHFMIADTGIGIPAEKQSQIFDAFVQVDGSSTREYGGTGLGLAITARLVEMMGDRIWIESDIGLGSRFHFTLTFDLSDEPAGQIEPVEPDLQLIDLSVLVVDDNATNRRILKQMLTNWHMCPVTVDGGHSALDALRRAADAGEPFPLVLLDGQMPDMDGFALAERIKECPELAGATIMMLTSGARQGDVVRCRELDIAAYLNKPVAQSDLLDAIVTALDGKLFQEEYSPSPPNTANRAVRHGLHILLTEDNRVNQTVAIYLLKKQDHTCRVACDGKEALDALEQEQFDLVLMDVQMPEMDGFEATAAIRKKEQATGEHIPIIAMTAHAMKGDRERCLEAGMDAYVSKPINSKSLFEAIDLLTSQFILPTNEDNAAAGKDIELNQNQIMARVDGDYDLLQELVDQFLADSPQMLAAIRTAIYSKDSTSLERSAHFLKGAVSIFGRTAAHRAAEQLEEMGRSQKMSQASEICTELEAEIERLESQLADVCERSGV